MSNDGKETPLIEISSPQSIHKNERFVTILIPSVIAGLAAMNFGFCLGYTSPTQAAILKDKTLNISDSDFSWFSALIGVGAIIGSLGGGYVVDALGRKGCILVTGAIYTPGWLLISYSTSVNMLFAGRVICGVGCGLSSLAAPLYIGEISSPKYRGGLGTLPQLNVNLGIFFAYAVGLKLSWEWLAIFGVVLVALMVVLMSFMPETPRWLLAHHQRDRALQGLVWLRGPEYDVEEECVEIETNLHHQEKASFSDLKSPSFYKPLMIGSLCMVFQQFSGINAVLFYDVKIFQTAGISDADQISLLVAGALVISVVIATFIVDKLGRRILLMISGVVMAICLILLGVYHDLADLGSVETLCVFEKYCHTVPLKNISWLAILCVLVYIILFSFGWGPLPWLLMSEIFPAKVRGYASSFVNLVNWSLVFLITRLFPQMTETFHLQGTFWFFAVFTIISFFFTYFFVPETKGKTLEEIELLFAR